MKLTVLGSGTAVPSAKRASPCILIETDEVKALCDTGPGSLRQLAKKGVRLDEIDSIVYSHLHIDHTADLAPFLFASKYAQDMPRTKHLHVIGPQGIKRFYKNLIKAYGSYITPDHFTIAWSELSEGSLLLNGLCVKAIPVAHARGSIALRFEEGNGKSIVYSGDTDYCNNIVTLARETDLLLLECSFPEHMKCEGHLIPSLAGTIARESLCKMLVLTHFYPPCDNHDLLTPLKNEFAGHVVLAEDLMSFNVT